MAVKKRTITVPAVGAGDSSVATKNQLQLLEDAIVAGPSIFGVFGGAQIDGVLTVAAPTATIADLGGGADTPLVKEYSSINITSTLTADCGWVIFGCGALVLSGTITTVGYGEAGGALAPGAGAEWGTAGRRADGYGVVVAADVDRQGDDTSNPYVVSSLNYLAQGAVPLCVTGSGGGGGGAAADGGGLGGGAGGPGGQGGGAAGAGAVGVATSGYKLLALTGGAGDNVTHGYSHLLAMLLRFRGAGGGSGGAQLAGSGGKGGDGGGVIYIECESLDFSGNLTSAGAAGAAGGQTGGGGGGGGIVLIRYKTLVNNAGAVSVVGGAGGAGAGAGAAGANGYKDIISVQ